MHGGWKAAPDPTPAGTPSQGMGAIGPPPAFHHRPSRGRRPRSSQRPDALLSCAASPGPRGAVRRGASAGCSVPSYTMIAAYSAHRSWSASGTSPLPASLPAAAGRAPRGRAPATHASWTSLHPPQAAAGRPATRFPRSAAWRASARPCGGPATAASRSRLSPNAWGKRRPRRGKPLLPALLERCA